MYFCIITKYCDGYFYVTLTGLRDAHIASKTLFLDVSVWVFVEEISI